MLLKPDLHDIINIIIIDIISIAADDTISPVFALPTRILSGIQNGDENGNTAANKLISLAGFIIEKYAK